MSAALQRAWLRRGAVARVLWPLAALFGVIRRVRAALYAAGLLRTTRVRVPVVVVGNVVAGGAGKTPVVLALLEHLQARGIAAGVVSRGHGRRSTGCREVRTGDDARDTGDEPLLVRRRSGVPVFVAERRVDAARALLAAHPATRCIVSDDGLQHLALARDIELCVFDARGVGNGWLLPAGPLREPWPRAVDLVLRPAGVPVDGFAVARLLAGYAERADGTRRGLAEFQGVAVHALAGIAQPEAFFAMLRSAGITPASERALPDHAAFEGIAWPEGTLLCTEKDADKLWRHRPDAWAVPLALDIDPAFWPAFDRLLDARLSSPAHGPETP